MQVIGQAGLVFFPRIPTENACSKEKHYLIQGNVRTGVEKARASSMVDLWQQGSWMSWESAVERWLTWAYIRFHISLPSPTNLSIWGKSKAPACSRCFGRRSIQHISRNCPKAIGKHHYCFNQVLKAAFEIVVSDINTGFNQHWSVSDTTFAKTSEKPSSQPRPTTGLLFTEHQRGDYGRALSTLGRAHGKDIWKEKPQVWNGWKMDGALAMN